MDIEMKPMNGLSATAKIRTTHPNAKVLIVSQYNEPEFREAANNAGACGYVFKENLIDIPNIIKEFNKHGGNKNEKVYNT
jgi:DNA-binding NarL/FixJ family response regulator